jgi:hypothetical protein
LDIDRHLYLCGFGRDEDALEVHAQWGDRQNQPFQLSFNAPLEVDFQGSRVTSDGGLILVRDLDERLGLEKLIEEHLSGSSKKGDQGRQAGGALDLAIMPSVPGQRSALRVEPAGIQPGQPVASPVKHARYYWMLLAEGHLHQRLFGQMLRRLYELPGAARVALRLRLQNLGPREEG